MSAGDVTDVTGDFRIGTWMCRDGNKGPRGPLDDDNVKSIRHSHRQCVEDSKSVASTHEGTREVTTSKYRQIGSVVSCFVANMFYGGLAASYGVMYTYLKESLVVSEEEVTWIGALFGGFSGIASIPGVVCVDGLGGRLTTLFGGLLAFTGFIIGSQVNDLNVLYFALGVLPGTGACFAYTATMVHVTEQFSKWRPVAVGISVTGLAVGMFTWPPLSAVTADTTGWRGTCLINGALTLHLVPCAMLITPRNSTNSSDGPSVSLRQTVVNCLQVFKIPGTITASIAHIAFGFSLYTFSTFVPEYVTTSISRLTATQAALVVTAPGYGSMAGRIIFSAISMATDKAANYIFLLSICGMGVTNLLIPLCENPTAFYINGTVYGLALGGFFGVLTLVLVQLFGLHNLSKTFGMLMMCLGFGAFGGSPIQSYLSTIYDRDIPFYLAGGSFILTMMLMLSVVMRKQMVVCGNRRQSFNLEVVGFHNAAFITGNQDATV
ncbi:monocarboxylate transporter 13-like [Haliotis cracherodii]|uniref:monocarboxylate transporter 13-like n=1 Tax=Haliotis cracherodii TaxID=6455 RepID=UPI0039EB97C8